MPGRDREEPRAADFKLIRDGLYLSTSVALLRDAPEDVMAIGRRAGELRDDLRFLLRAIHVVVRRAIDDDIRPRRRDCCVDRRRVSHIKLVAIERVYVGIVELPDDRSAEKAPPTKMPGSNSTRSLKLRPVKKSVLLTSVSLAAETPRKPAA